MQVQALREALPMPRELESGPRPWRFTVAEYHRMAEVGILGEVDRVELLDGELVTMSPVGRPHSSTVSRLTHLFVERAGKRANVWVQNPVVLDDHSEPQPDVVLLAFREDFYQGKDPSPADALLAIEVGDSSASFDRRVKAPLYARAGIRELWLVDVNTEVITVHRKPGPDGLYSEIRRLRRGERLDVEALPGVELTVEEVLGPKE